MKLPKVMPDFPITFDPDKPMTCNYQDKIDERKKLEDFYEECALCDRLRNDKRFSQVVSYVDLSDRVKEFSSNRRK
jgi:hypothetical protein